MVTERDLLIEGMRKKIPVHVPLTFPITSADAGHFYIKTSGEVVIGQAQPVQNVAHLNTLDVPQEANDLEKEYIRIRNELIQKAFPFDALGITRASTLQQIEYALKRKRLLVHPDKVPPAYQADATEVFKYLTKARDEAVKIKLSR